MSSSITRETRMFWQIGLAAFVLWSMSVSLWSQESLPSQKGHAIGSEPVVLCAGFFEERYHGAVFVGSEVARAESFRRWGRRCSPALYPVCVAGLVRPADGLAGGARLPHQSA